MSAASALCGVPQRPNHDETGRISVVGYSASRRILPGSPALAFGGGLAMMYIRLYSPMRFDWDEDKSDLNLATRGFDFEFASQVFEGPTLERIDDRKEYGEVRVVAIGRADGHLLTVVNTDGVDVGEIVRRIISARRSNHHERQAYRQAVEKAQSRPS